MVELDVLRHGDRLVVAHDPAELGHPSLVGFEEALRALAGLVGPSVRFDVDIKATGYEREVAAAISGGGIAERTLVSTMERASLAVLRREAPELKLGLSVPLARRNYLAHPLTRPGAYGMLAYLRRVLPDRVAHVLDAGRGGRDHGPLGRGHRAPRVGRHRPRRRAVRVDGRRRPPARIACARSASPA